MRKGQTPKNFKEFREKGSLACIGRTPWNKGKKTGIISSSVFKKGHITLLSEESRKKISQAVKKLWQDPEYIKKHSEAQRGEKGSNWRGGVTPINKTIRKSIEFRRWREAVFTRDNWTCQECGEKGGILHPDHIKQFAYYPELRFSIDNGRTLCKDCHMKTDTWGYKTSNKNFERSFNYGS